MILKAVTHCITQWQVVEFESFVSYNRQWTRLYQRPPLPLWPDLDLTQTGVNCLSPSSCPPPVLLLSSYDWPPWVRRHRQANGLPSSLYSTPQPSPVYGRPPPEVTLNPPQDTCPWPSGQRSYIPACIWPNASYETSGNSICPADYRFAGLPRLIDWKCLCNHRGTGSWLFKNIERYMRTHSFHSSILKKPNEIRQWLPVTYSLLHLLVVCPYCKRGVPASVTPTHISVFGSNTSPLIDSLTSIPQSMKLWTLVYALALAGCYILYTTSPANRMQENASFTLTYMFSLIHEHVGYT